VASQPRRAANRQAGQPASRRTPAHKPPTLRYEREVWRAGAGLLAAVDEVGRGALAGPVSVGVVLLEATTKPAPLGVADSKLLTPQARQRLVPRIRRWALDCAVGHASAAEIDQIGIIAALRVAAERAMSQLAAAPDWVLLDGNHDYLTPRPVVARCDQPSLFEDSTGAESNGSESYGSGLRRALPTVAEPDRAESDRAESGRVGSDRVGSGRVGPALDGSVRWRCGVPVHTLIKGDLRCSSIAAASVLAKTERDGMLIELAEQYPQYGFAENKAYASPQHLAALLEHGPSAIHRCSWNLPGLAGRDGISLAEALEMPELIAGLTDDLAMGDDGQMTSAGPSR
jgi:ribonuclease HII